MKNTTHEEITSKSRVARMVNALTFALQSHAVTPHLEDKAREALQVVHSVWLLGGYLYEAIHLVDDLSTRHGKETRFKRLEQFARNIRLYRELFAEFNLNPSFNMDWGGDTTRKAIATMGNTTLYYTPEAVDDGAIYPGIFRLDIQYLQDKSDQLVSDDELDGLIRHGLRTYAQMFIDAGIEFIGERPGKNFIDPFDPEKGAPPEAAAAKAVGFASMPAEPAVDEPEYEVDPEIMAKIIATCDPDEVHSRVPICFGGDFDPDA